jgi:hypothetical protein
MAQVQHPHSLLDELWEHLERVPAAAQQGHGHAQHNAQPAGLAFGFYEGPQGGAQGRGRQRGGEQYDAQRGRILTPVELHHHDSKAHQQQHLHHRQR